MRSTSSAASVASHSASSEPASRRSPSANPILVVSRTSPGDGRTFRCSGTCAHFPSSPVSVTCSVEAFPASRSAPPLDGARSRPTCGPSTAASSERAIQLGLRLKTSLVLAMTELSGCPAISKLKVIRSGRSMLTLRYLRDSVAGIESSGWPTPTTRYNIDSPSMRKWPAYAIYQDRVGRTTPPLWEWMMAFPRGWTASDSSATPSHPTSLKSSGKRS